MKLLFILVVAALAVAQSEFDKNMWKLVPRLTKIEFLTANATIACNTGVTKSACPGGTKTVTVRRLSDTECETVTRVDNDDGTWTEDSDIQCENTVTTYETVTTTDESSSNSGSSSSNKGSSSSSSNKGSSSCN